MLRVIFTTPVSFARVLAIAGKHSTVLSWFELHIYNLMKLYRNVNPCQLFTAVILAASVATLTACSSSDDSEEDSLGAAVDPEFETNPIDATARELDTGLFADGAMVGDVSTEDCTLSGGSETTCYRLTIVGEPKDGSLEGPYCPPAITSTAEEGGTWIDGSDKVYDVDGDFIVNLSTLYNDDRWQMYDPDTGLVTVIDGTEGCDVAGDPNNTTGTDNFCLECTIESLGGGVELSFLIPMTPVFQGAAEDVGNSDVGVALNGVVFGPPAPIDLILSSYTLGVFDDCGGHSNPHEGYHYHAANGCSEVVTQEDGHAPMIGYAMDGYPIYAHLNAQGEVSTDLDECGGTSDDVRGYHYHAQAAGTNQIIGCYMGERIASDDNDGPPGGGPRGGGPPGGGPPQ